MWCFSTIISTILTIVWPWVALFSYIKSFKSFTICWIGIHQLTSILESSICTLLKYTTAAAAAAKSLQSWPTLWDPIDSSPPGSPVPGILQARTLEWVAISFSSAWKWKVRVKSLSRARLLATPWTAAYQAPPSMGVPRQEYWSGWPVPLWNACLLSHISCVRLCETP